MICKNCGQYFVRYPCPSCGREREQEAMETVTSETIRKPSEIRKASLHESKVQNEDTLIRPSQLIETPLREQEEIIDSDEERLVKPSQLRGGSAVNPKFKADSETITLKSQESQQIVVQKKTKAEIQTKPQQRHLQIAKQVQKIKIDTKAINSNLKSKNETDEQYKNRVRKTLLEVMGLLEKLIE